MSSLLDRAPSARRPATGEPLSPVVAGAWAAAQAAAASLALVLLPVVAAWAAAGTSVAWLQAVRVGLAAWLLAHHAGISVPGGQVGLTPLGLTAVAVATCWFCARRLTRGLDPHGAAIRAGVGRVAPAAAPAWALGGFALGYAAVGGSVAALAGTDLVRPVLLQAVLGTGVVAGVTAAAASLSYAGSGWRGGFAQAADLARLPAAVRRMVAPALLALAALLAICAVVVLAALLASLDRVLAVQRALDPGAVGGGALVVAQLAVLPNLAVWAAAFCAGPGFALGVGTSVTPAVSTLGALPAVPLLGVLPAPGEQPGWARLVIAVPLVAGVLAGWLAVRRRPGDPVSEAMLDGVGAAVLAAAGFVLLAWLSGGPAGPGRLAVTGPQPLAAGGMLAVELCLGALGGGLISRGLDGGWHRLHRRRSLASG